MTSAITAFRVQHTLRLAWHSSRDHDAAINAVALASYSRRPDAMMLFSREAAVEHVLACKSIGDLVALSHQDSTFYISDGTTRNASLLVAEANDAWTSFCTLLAFDEHLYECVPTTTGVFSVMIHCEQLHDTDEVFETVVSAELRPSALVDHARVLNEWRTACAIPWPFANYTTPFMGKPFRMHVLGIYVALAQLDALNISDDDGAHLRAIAQLELTPVIAPNGRNLHIDTVSLPWRHTALRPSSTHETDEAEQSATTRILAHCATNTAEYIYGGHEGAADESADDRLELLAHQRCTVAWMRDLERYPIGRRVWVRPSPEASYVYAPALGLFRRYNPASAEGERAPLAAGGMLLDEVGLGKTRTIIALAHGDCEGTPPTLIVVPLSVIGQWRHEANWCGVPHVLYYGPQRRRQVLADARVVITTMTTLEYELRQHLTPSESDGPAPANASMRSPILSGFRFERLVCDESHKLTQGTRAACARINTTKRWCVTATPISGASDSTCLQRQFDFLHLDLPVTATWYHNVLMNDATGALPSLAHVFTRIASRAIASTVASTLPHVHQHIETINLSDADEAAYLSLEQRELRLCRTHARHGAAAFRAFERVLAALSLGMIGRESVMPASLAVMSPDEAADVALDDVCSICLDPHNNPTMTSCRHVFCYACITSALRQSSRCPCCRRTNALQQLRLVLPLGDNEAEDTSVRLHAISQRVLECGERCVIFSNYPSTLSHLRLELEQCARERSVNMRAFELRGNMSRAMRERQLREFNTPGVDNGSAELHVFFLTLRTAAAGLNLQSASRLFFCEPLMSPLVEEQAIGRVRRIGQRALCVNVHTFVTRNTIEEALHRARARDSTWRPNVGNLIAITRERGVT